MKSANETSLEFGQSEIAQQIVNQMILREKKIWWIYEEKNTVKILYVYYIIICISYMYIQCIYVHIKIQIQIGFGGNVFLKYIGGKIRGKSNVNLEFGGNVRNKGSFL